MKRKAFVLVLALASFSQSVLAQEFTWKGVQIFTALGGESQDALGPFGVRASIHHLWIPENDTNLLFTYVGPTWSPAEWLWLSPQIGTAVNVMADNKDALNLSLWGEVTLLDERLSIFLEGDGYFRDSESHYYGFYSLDWNIEPFSTGVQAEQFDKAVDVGPHVMICKEPWCSKVEYYMGFQDANYGHAIRISTSLSF
jgi:hypothetical protein